MNRLLAALALTVGTASVVCGQHTVRDCSSCDTSGCVPSAGRYAGMMDGVCMSGNCMPVSTIRVLEGDAWRVVDEPVCAGGCASQGCLAGFCQASSPLACDASGCGGCDASSCDTSGCDACTSGGARIEQFPLLGKLLTGPRVRTRAKLMRRTVVQFEPRVEFQPGWDFAPPCSLHIDPVTDYHAVQLWLDRFEESTVSPLADVVDRAPDELTEGAVVRWLDLIENPADDAMLVDWGQGVELEQGPAPINRVLPELPPVVRATSLLPAPNEIVPGTVQR
jgi:hypothetical protein